MDVTTNHVTHAPHERPSHEPVAAPGSVCPIDLSPLRPVAPASADDVARAVRRARHAQEQWRDTPVAARVEAMRQAAKSMLARRHEVVSLVRTEIGKTDAEAIFHEALGPLDTLNAWVSVIEKHAARESVFLNPVSFPGKRAWVDLVPRGVVGVIAPWNYPVAGLYRSVFPALLTGNAVVLKPSEHAPRSSAWLIDALAPFLPEGLVAVVQGDGRVGAMLLDADLDACVFTGSPETGRAVRIRCAEKGIPSSVEMGGKDAAIVLADCDLERTVAGVTAWALGNAGQACGAIEVAYVEATIADAFVARLAHAWSRLRAAPGPMGETDVGPLAHQRQFDLVRAHVDDARERGAVVACGGAPTGVGLYYLPTVLDRCTDDMAVVRDETFGPVLAVVRVEGASDAVARVNRARYGLGCSIWSRDIDRAHRLAARLDVGVVTVNNHALSGAIPSLPWSGTRATGHGVANSHHALATFVRPRAVITDRSSQPELYWAPFDRELVEFGDTLCDVQRGVIDRTWRLPFLLRAHMQRLKKFFAEESSR